MKDFAARPKAESSEPSLAGDGEEEVERRPEEEPQREEKATQGQQRPQEEDAAQGERFVSRTNGRDGLVE